MKMSMTVRMASSLKGAFFACQAAARVMIPRGGGKIVNIGSNFGVIAFKSRSIYAGAKAGVHHMSSALSLEGPDRVSASMWLLHVIQRRLRVR
jgi:NAD(P)-dependent dehydrogenase (short-subunit alcohol dehydrogenase family)